MYNGARLVSTPYHSQFYRGRKAVHRLVDDTSPAKVSQGGRNQCHTYVPGDETDDGLHEPDVFLYRSRNETRLMEGLSHLSMETRHRIKSGEDKRFLGEGL